VTEPEDFTGSGEHPPGPLVLPQDEYEAVKACLPAVLDALRIAVASGGYEYERERYAGALVALGGGEEGQVGAESVTPAEAFQADLAGLREQVGAALDRSIDRCARCKVCDTQIGAVMAAIGAEFDRMHAALEHAASAAAGSHEGMRLWMLDCGELVAKHRTRAEADARKLAAIAAYVEARKGDAGLSWMHALDILAIIGSEEADRARD
jgi:hypothetical protein